MARGNGRAGGVACAEHGPGPVRPTGTRFVNLQLDLRDIEGVLGGLRMDPHPGDEVGRLSCREARSEEHTSELQSRENLVCRLLLEKKKPRNLPPMAPPR